MIYDPAVGGRPPCGRHWGHTSEVEPMSVQVQIDYQVTWTSSIDNSGTTTWTADPLGTFDLFIGEIQSLGTRHLMSLYKAPMMDPARWWPGPRGAGVCTPPSRGTLLAVDGSRRQRGAPTRVVRAGALAAVAGAVVLLAVSVQRVFWPAESLPEAVDAVVVLGGGRGERHDRAIELIDAGVADTLVVSAVSDLPRLRRRIEELCAGPAAFKVECFVPEPGTTRGEAAAVAELIEQRGWRSIALVTSDFHLDRATVTFRYCTNATIHPVASRGARRVDWVAKEIVGFTYVRTMARGCLTAPEP